MTPGTRFVALLAVWALVSGPSRPAPAVPSAPEGPPSPFPEVPVPDSASGGTAPSRADPDRGGGSGRDSLSRILETMYRGDLAGARSAVERLEAERPDDPWVRLVGVRVDRETLNDQDEEKERIKRAAAPLLRRLERARELVGGRMVDGRATAGDYLLRGWIDMDRGQLYALSKSFWKAAKAAKSGKGDLERCLEMDPENLDAKGMLGVYLYFADSLPSFFKVLRALLFLPGGNRELGLRYLEECGASSGLASVDARIFRAAIDVGFEGRLEAGFERFREIRRDYPENPRYAEPLAMTAFFLPPVRAETVDLIDKALSQCRESRERFHRDLAFRLFYHRAQLQITMGRTDRALEDLRRILDLTPSSPDWLLPSATALSVELLADRGDWDRAQDAVRWLRSIRGYEKRAEAIEKRLEELRRGQETGPEADAPSGKAESLRRAEEMLRAGDEAGAGEIWRREGAEGRHGDLLATRALLSASWLAAREGDFEEAADLLRNVREQYRLVDIQGVLFEARLDYLGSRAGEDGGRP